MEVQTTVTWVPTACKLPPADGLYLAAVRTDISMYLTVTLLGYIRGDNVWIDTDGNEISEKIEYWAKLPTAPDRLEVLS